MTRCTEQQEVYSWLGKNIGQSASFILQQGELYKQFLGSGLKYQKFEHESYRELLKQRDEFKNSFLKQEKSLSDKKEKLLKSKDLKKWGYLGDVNDIVKLHEKLLANKEAAFTYMLQKDSKDLELNREELSFYSNQCLNETRRVGKDNGSILIDHFIMMS